MQVNWALTGYLIPNPVSKTPNQSKDPVWVRAVVPIVNRGYPTRIWYKSPVSDHVALAIELIPHRYGLLAHLDEHHSNKRTQIEQELAVALKQYSVLQLLPMRR